MKQIKVSADELLELIGLIYQGPMEEKPWTSSLELLKKYLNANFVTLAIRPTTFALPGVVLAAGTLPLPLVRAYHDQFFSLDPFVELPSDAVVTSDELFTEQEWISKPYYTEYLSTLNIYRIMGVDINVSEEMNCPFRVSRPKSLPAFDMQDKQLCNYLIPHFRRSVLIYSKIVKQKTVESLYERTIDEMMLGVIMLSEEGDLIKSNKVANKMLADEDGLLLKNNRLQTVFDSDSVKFRTYLKEALALSFEGKKSAFEVMTINRKNGHAGLSIAVHSIPAGSWTSGGKRPAVAIFIRDSVYKIEGQDGVVSKLFNLTPAEASLAIKIMNGMSLDEAAEASGIKRNTARAHLRSIFSKVDVTRQSDLMRVLLNSVASFSGRKLMEHE